MLSNLNPHSLAAEHPMFERDVRRIRWGASAEGVRRVSMKWLLLVIGIFVGLWLLAVIPTLDDLPAYQYGWRPAMEHSNNFMGYLAIISIGANLLLDFVSLWVSMSSVGGEISAGRWDLMRLTSLHERGIVMAKYAVAQLRAWRFTMIILAARVAVVVLFLLHIILLPNLLGEGHLNLNIRAEDFAPAVLAIITAVIFTLTAIAEALWRMQTLTALGVLVSTYTRSVVYSVLMSFGVMVVVWITQAIVIGAIAYILSLFMRMLSNASVVGGTCFVLFACIATAAAIYFYYRRVRTWALGRATRRVFIAD